MNVIGYMVWRNYKLILIVQTTLS
ncbi:MAG: hypothetical protein JWQ25_2694, partial [Daejeonella sp.]|nr:hypothetical protein [Daejeonella sp.]